MSKQVRGDTGQSRADKAAAASPARRQARRKLAVRVGVGVVAVGAVLFGAFRIGGGGSTTTGQSGGSGPRFDVGSPGPGAQAPSFVLPSTAGGTFDLSAARGKTVLLYFQEGIGCQPCWDQIHDLERGAGDLKALGIDEVVSITSNELPLLRQKVADEKLTTPVLADPELTLGKTYNANRYGMMGLSRYGHTFIVVGADGRIRWRADYGGSPNYTMYVKMPALLADLRAGLGAS